MAAKFTLFPILLTANFYNFKFGKLSKNYNNDSRYSNTNGSTCFENSLELFVKYIFFNFAKFRSQENDAAAYSRC